MRRKIVAMTIALGLLGMPSFGHADEDCDVSVDDASGGNAQIVDVTGDAQGVVLGDGQGGPLGDVYQSPDDADDIIAAYIKREADGSLAAHVVVKDLLGPEAGLIYYLIWDHPGSDSFRRQRWVQALLKPYRDVAGAPEFGYGYFGPKPAGDPGFNKVGDTTGRIVVGSPGEIVIDLPAGTVVPDPWSTTDPPAMVNTDDWGAPAPGSTLRFEPSVSGNPFGAESRMLAGSPEPLPRPSPFTHGFVFAIDNSTNALKFCTASV